jgi:hypothetical protein
VHGDAFSVDMFASAFSKNSLVALLLYRAV